MHFSNFIFIISLSFCLECNIDKNRIIVNETYNNKYQLSITNNGEANSSIYIPKNSYFTTDKQAFIVLPGTQQSFQITLNNVNLTLHENIISIYCYNQFNPDDNKVLQVQIVNDFQLCGPSDTEVVEGDCNDESYMTISYKYKETSKCKETKLLPNEIVRCYKENLMKPASIGLISMSGLLLILWIIGIYMSYKHFDMYKQYFPPQYILVYILGIMLIALYEGLLSFSDSKSNCMTIIVIGAISHGIHAASAISLASYMYFEDKSKHSIKNNILYLVINIIWVIILQIMYKLLYIIYIFIIIIINSLIIFGFMYYYKYGRNVELLSGLSYTLPFCDNSPSTFIYIIPLIIKFLTIHYYTLYNIVSKSSSLYLYQIWRIVLSCIMITYYITGIILSKEYFIGPHRIYLALTITVVHIFSLFIYYTVGKDVKKENLRPKLATHILIDDIYRECFRMYLAKDKLDNLLSFYEDYQLFKKFTANHVDRIHTMLSKIVPTYISPNASKPLSILPNEIKDTIIRYYEHPNDDIYNNNNNYGYEVLDKASMIVYCQLENHFPWFLKSPQAEYMEEPYSWLEEYSDFHNSLQYAIRVRMCENAVTDKETGFSYPMSRGRITNPNSCFQLEDIPQIFGSYKVDLKNRIESMNQATPGGGGGGNPGGKVNGNGGNGLLAKFNGINPNNYNPIETNDTDTMSRGNVYIPATCATNEGCMAYGYATLATECSVGAFTSGTNRTMKSIKVANGSINMRSTNLKNEDNSPPLL